MRIFAEIYGVVAVNIANGKIHVNMSNSPCGDMNVKEARNFIMGSIACTHHKDQALRLLESVVGVAVCDSEHVLLTKSPAQLDKGRPFVDENNNGYQYRMHSDLY